MVEIVFSIEHLTQASNSNSFSDSLDHWQTLIGSALGVFFAALIPIGSYFYKKHADRVAEKKENLRRIEVAATQSFQEIYNVKELMELAIGEIGKVIADVEGAKSGYSLARTNFPVTAEIYRDPNLRELRLDSYYLHNKLLIADTLLKDMNRVIRDMKMDYADHMRLNELLVFSKAPPEVQRQIYADALKTFSDALKSYLTKQFPIALRLLMEIKVFNGLLRGNFRGTLSEYENWVPWPRRMFVSTKETRGLNTIVEIDERIARAVEKEIEAAEEQAMRKVP